MSITDISIARSKRAIKEENVMLLIEAANKANALRFARWNVIVKQLENTRFTMENILESENDLSNFDSSTPLNVRPCQFYVAVDGLTGTRWVTFDPDGEDELTFNKDRKAAFEFQDYEHAKRARDIIGIEMNVEAFILGEMREY
jgi:hypothetical protein